jgi:uncharacterized cupin superfamily protein
MTGPDRPGPYAARTMSAPPLAHHADIPESEITEGDIAFRRRRLGSAAGAQRIGCSHYLVGPGARQMPLHVHGDEEEIFYVLGGDGLTVDGDRAYAVGVEDAVVQRPGGRPHTFLAGESGLELIAFGSGSETSLTFLPRAGVMWCGPRWVPLDAPHPFTAEGLAGPLTPPPVDPAVPRPGHIVALADVATQPRPAGAVRQLGAAAGAVKAGLNHVTLAPGACGAPAHCHSLEEELFVVLSGTGTLTLGVDTRPLIAGDVVVRPAGTGVTHALHAGADGLAYLVYGTREPGDAVYLPDAGTVRLSGLGVTLTIAASASA